MSGHGTPIPMTSHPCGPLTGVADVPGDKSISHRSLILGAMAVGETRITGLLEGEDVLDTAKAMRAFGAEVIDHGGGSWSVHGVGVGGFAEPENVERFIEEQHQALLDGLPYRDNLDFRWGYVDWFASYAPETGVKMG